MPKVRHSRSKPPPEGWDTIEPTLESLRNKMRDAESETHEGKRKVESLWPVFRINHQMSRYIYECYYKRNLISKELFQWCLKEKWGDKELISKWRKQGYEKLCCLKCIQPGDTEFNTTCICRVPKSQRDDKAIECLNCGCRGCASTD